LGKGSHIMGRWGVREEGAWGWPPTQKPTYAHGRNISEVDLKGGPRIVFLTRDPRSPLTKKRESSE